MRKSDTLPKADIVTEKATTLDPQAANQSGLSKIAYLMEKLQEKIALRVRI
jgi:hypothetical protein